MTHAGAGVVGSAQLVTTFSQSGAERNQSWCSTCFLSCVQCRGLSHSGQTVSFIVTSLETQPSNVS